MCYRACGFCVLGTCPCSLLRIPWFPMHCFDHKVIKSVTVTKKTDIMSQENKPLMQQIQAINQPWLCGLVLTYHSSLLSTPFSSRGSTDAPGLPVSLGLSSNQQSSREKRTSVIYTNQIIPYATMTLKQMQFFTCFTPVTVQAWA